MPECPNGKFCVAAKDAAGSPKASAPFSACAETVSDPTPAPSESRQIRFDAVTTKVERASAADACCYSWYVPCPGGRPLLVEGEARVAAEARSAAWLEDDAVLDSAPALDASTRSALAMHYAREAAYEHASVAAFARVSLSLLAAGAPPDLVADTHRAALDEIEHARAMYGVASNLRDAPIGPGPLDLSGVASPTASIVEIAEEAFLEGCVGEAAAALVLREEARAATSIEIRAILERIADDEERHAELAWRTVQWALGADDGVRGALERAMRLLSEEQTLPPEDAHVLPGIVGTRGRLLARRAAIHEVVEPCLRALLARGQAS